MLCAAVFLSVQVVASDENCHLSSANSEEKRRWSLAQKLLSLWGGRREGAGPKPKPASEQKRNVVRVLLTDDERVALDGRVAREGVSLSSWLRRLVLHELKRRD